MSEVWGFRKKDAEWCKSVNYKRDKLTWFTVFNKDIKPAVFVEDLEKAIEAFEKTVFSLDGCESKSDWMDGYKYALDLIRKFLKAGK